MVTNPRRAKLQGVGHHRLLGLVEFWGDDDERCSMLGSGGVGAVEIGADPGSIRPWDHQSLDADVASSGLDGAGANRAHDDQKQTGEQVHRAGGRRVVVSAGMGAPDQ